MNAKHAAAGLIVLAAVLLAGCVTERYVTATVPVVVRDRQTGELLDDCLFVQRFEQRPMTLECWVPRQMPYDVQWADIRRLDCGDLVRQDAGAALSIHVYILTYFYTDVRYGYMVFRAGYLPCEVDDFALNLAADRKMPLVVEMSRLGSGQLAARLPSESRGLASLVRCRDMAPPTAADQILRLVIPYLPRANPLRRELLELMGHQLREAVSSRDPTIWSLELAGWKVGEAEKELLRRIDELLAQEQSTTSRRQAEPTTAPGT